MGGLDLSQKLPKYIKDGYIRASRHPVLPITIYNYTQQATFEEKWDEITTTCRGLILDDYGRIIIKGPRKFFNREEEWADKFDIREAIISEKLDGYYISLKQDGRYGFIISSRGSFCNKYTAAAEKLITSEIRRRLERNIQYFCELCQNFEEDSGIIVTKHPVPKLVCWAMRGEDGKEIIPTTENCPFEIAKKMTPDEASKYLTNEVEGVVAFKPDTEQRVKIKTDWFLRTHRIISDCTKRKVWEINKDGGKVADLDIPNEFLSQMKEWEAELQNKVNAELDRIQNLADKYANCSDKELGLSNIDSYTKSQIFNQRKGRKDSILKQIYLLYKDEF